MGTTPSKTLCGDASGFERLEDQAQVLRLGWAGQLIDRQDLVTWADSWLPREVTPFELSVLADLSVPTLAEGDDVRQLLDAIASPSTDLHILALVGVVAQAYKAGRLGEDEAARRLFYLASAHDILPRELFCFWDELDLARDQYLGDLEEVRSRFEKCLAKHARLAGWLNLKSV